MQAAKAQSGPSRAAQVAAQQEEQHEDRGSEFERGGDTDPDPAWPSRRPGQAVDGDQCHEQCVDLAREQGGADGFEQQRGGQRPGQEPPHPGARLACGGGGEAPEAGRDADDGDGGEQPVRRAVADERQRDEGQGGERRVGERQLVAAGELGQPAVQIAAVQHHLGAGAVDVQVEAVAAQAAGVAEMNEVDRGGGQVQRHEQRGSPSAREVHRRSGVRPPVAGREAEIAHGDLQRRSGWVRRRAVSCCAGSPPFAVWHPAGSPVRRRSRGEAGLGRAA